MRYLIGPDGVSGVLCPRCGCALFELLPLGIPGAGSSSCLWCRLPVAAWSHG